MSTKIILRAAVLLFVLNLCVFPEAFGQEIPPLVYDVEFTGVDCTKPPLPAFEELPIIEPLTDPFEWSDRSGRDTTFAAWTKRRAEIKAEIEHYEIGPKPERPDTIEAMMDGDTLRVDITVNGNTLNLTSVVTLPEGEGPFPAVIGMGSGSGSLPSNIFTSRDIALIPFNYGQVLAWQQVRGEEPINELYPDLTYAGSYSGWSWGVSRLIDGLELVADSLPIDLEHLAVTGCSFAGKMALFAGAYDERIALTIPQEPGGGGAAAWRVSETVMATVETLGSTSHVWFMESMFQFAGQNVSKLPHDHHELVAMIAPRAVFVLGNSAQVWLAEESGYTSCAAARKVWENFGIEDRMGYSFDHRAEHCFNLPQYQIDEVGAFVDKFLLGDTTVNTNITTNNFDYIVPEYWTDWWGNGEPYFPILDRGDAPEVWFEAECGTTGAAWNTRMDTAASNGYYVVVKDSLNNRSAPADSGAAVYLPFNIEVDTTYYVYARLNCPTYDNDALWMKLDDGNYQYVYSLKTEGWEWKNLGPVDLTPGEHTLAIAFREEGLQMDKFCMTTFFYPPGGKGVEADLICEPDTTTVPYSVLGLSDRIARDGFALGQNYPNPLNDLTSISFEIPRSAHVSLKVYSQTGEEIEELAGKTFPAGLHTVNFNSRRLSEGIYFYRLNADAYTATRKMIILRE